MSLIKSESLKSAILEQLARGARQRQEIKPRLASAAVEIYKAPILTPARIDLVAGTDYSADGKLTSTFLKEMSPLGPACTLAGFSKRHPNPDKNWNYTDVHRVVKIIRDKKGAVTDVVVSIVAKRRDNPLKDAAPVAEQPKEKRAPRKRKPKETIETETIAIDASASE